METKEINTHWFDLSSVQFSPVQHDGVSGITCPGSLDGCGEHVQKVLRRRFKELYPDLVTLL